MVYSESLSHSYKSIGGRIGCLAAMVEDRRVGHCEIQLKKSGLPLHMCIAARLLCNDACGTHLTAGSNVLRRVTSSGANIRPKTGTKQNYLIIEKKYKQSLMKIYSNTNKKKLHTN